MYNKIETNDDGDISMKHVVIHLKGEDSVFKKINCTKKCRLFHPFSSPDCKVLVVRTDMNNAGVEAGSGNNAWVNNRMDQLLNTKREVGLLQHFH